MKSAQSRTIEKLWAPSGTEVNATSLIKGGTLPDEAGYCFCA